MFVVLYYVLILIVSFAVISLPVFAQQVIATVPVGAKPIGVVVNAVTNKTYVVNGFCNDDGCSPGTVTVIDGATDNTTTVDVGVSPFRSGEPGDQQDLRS